MTRISKHCGGRHSSESYLVMEIKFQISRKSITQNIGLNWAEVKKNNVKVTLNQ